MSMMSACVVYCQYHFAYLSSHALNAGEAPNTPLPYTFPSPAFNAQDGRLHGTMADIVVFGSIVHDLTSYTEIFPRPGESVRGLSFESGPGGKGSNQAVQAARLGGSVVMIGRVGRDMFGQLNIDALKSSDVITDYIEVSDTVGTATAMVTVSQHGENSIVVTLGANLELTPDRAEAVESVIAKAKILICQYEIKVDALKKALEVARRNNVRTFFNFAPGERNFDKAILKNVDILCTNENETEFLSGMSAKTVEDAMNASKSLLSYGPSAVIATLGKNGSVIATKDGLLKHVEANVVKAVDTTGAGDSFCGALAYFLVYRPHLPFEEQVRRASYIASISVQHKGTQCSYPWAKDLPADIMK
ncbi:Ribokinase [Toxocara canis]|uniref:Ribokinase n=1 Tax=Toxocara canis TaxID=6265 RepID=A0A0B2VUH0_TOXCA|nr:Ribokinase [Toxocara canis]